MTSPTVLLSAARLYSEKPGGRQRQLMLLADHLRNEGLRVVLFSSERRLEEIGTYRPLNAFLRGLRTVRSGKFSSLLFSFYLRSESARKRSERFGGRRTARNLLFQNLTRLTAGFGRAFLWIGVGGFRGDVLISRTLRQNPMVAFQTLQMIEVMRKIRPDFAVGFGERTSVPMLVASSYFSVQTIVSERVGGFGQRHGSVGDFVTALYQRATLLSSNNREVAEELELAFPDNQVSYIANLIDPVPLDTIENRNLTACVAARLVKRKRTDACISAVRELLDQGVSMSLTIYGSGAEQPRLEKLAQGLGVNHLIMFAGWKRQGEIPFESFRFYIANGMGEGASNSLEQALLKGCVPIVAEDPAKASEIFTASLRESLFTDGSSEQIARTVKSLSEDKDLLSSVQQELSSVRNRTQESSREALERYLEFFGRST